MLLEEHTDIRSEPRYRHLLEVRIGNLELTTANISLHGMQLVCPVMPFNRIKADAQKGQLSAQISIPRGGPFGATLSVCYCSRYGDEVLIGVRMAVTDPDAGFQWAAFIKEVAGGIRLGPGRAAGS